MSELTKEEQEFQEKELEILKNEARTLGIPIGGNLSADTLRHRIEEAKKQDKEEDEKLVKDNAAKRKQARQVKHSFTEMQNAELKMTERKRAASKLHRVTITCHDPIESKTGGRIFTVGNTAFGTERKYVPYGRAWHVSTMMLNSIREKKFITHTIEKVNGREVNRHFETPMYSIHELPPISTKELETLARQQQQRLGD